MLNITRRSFIKLVPAGALVIAGAWWLLRRSEGAITIASQAPTSTTNSAFDFPITWNGDQPITIDPYAYRLKIDGDVANPLELTLEELSTMTTVQKTLLIHCVEGWDATVPWEGIPLSHLVQQAGPLPGVSRVTITATTGYSVALSSSEVENADNMIALRAGGAVLTVDHGYPARLVVPSRPGEDWVKCVTRITCSSG